MTTQNVIHVVDDDEAVRDSLTFLLESANLAVRTYESASTGAARRQVIVRMRDFSKRGETARAPESINRLVQEASALALVAAKEQSVKVEYKLNPDLCPVLVDKIQIEQVLVNLLRNAFEATEGRERREIVITTSGQADGKVMVSVADTGAGLTLETAGRLFQPFVTTKQRGTGVGLSISRAIIESHGGTIWAQCNPEAGATFCFTLPLIISASKADG
jgi:two-component system sensor kinase FixL